MIDLWRALRYLWKYWGTTLGAFLSLLIVTATNLFSPQLLRRIGRNAQVAGDGISSDEANAVNICCKLVGIFGNHFDSTVTVLFVDFYGVGRRDLVALPTTCAMR
jgi:hypothetical protein